MKLSPKYLDRIGVDRAAWARVARNPYGWRVPIGQHRPRSVVLRGGPLADTLVSMHAPESGSLPLKGGRYVWKPVGKAWKSIGYLEWEARP